MHSSEAIYCQRVNSPILIKNLDATKISSRPPSSALDRLKYLSKPDSPLTNHIRYLDDNQEEVLSINEIHSENYAPEIKSSDPNTKNKDTHPKSNLSTRNQLNRHENNQPKFIDVTNRQSYFCGDINSVNERLVDLANIGRCDLYKRKEPTTKFSSCEIEDLHESMISLLSIDSISSMSNSISDRRRGQRSCFMGLTNPYAANKREEKVQFSVDLDHKIPQYRHARNKISATESIQSILNSSAAKSKKGNVNSNNKKNASQDLKMLNLVITPELDEIEQGLIDIPLHKVTLAELIDKLDDIEGLTFRNYSKQQLLQLTPLIQDTFWYIFLEKFYKHTKNRNKFNKKQIAKCQDNLLLKISAKFVDFLMQCENYNGKSKNEIKFRNLPSSAYGNYGNQYGSYGVSGYPNDPMEKQREKEKEHRANSNFLTPKHNHFFKQLPTMLALVLYSTFCHSWKDSWSNFVDPEFRQYLLDKMSIWIEGIKHVPGKGEHDGFWRRVEPFALRQDKSRSDKQSSVKTIAEHLNSTLGTDSEKSERSRWEKGFSRVTLMNKLGGKVNQRKNTIANPKLHKKAFTDLLNKDNKAIVFESSKFNINGRSPLFQLHIDHNFGPNIGNGKFNEEYLVSRRSCVDKKYWNKNPLLNAHSCLRKAQRCAKSVKKS